MAQAFIGEIRLFPYNYAPRGWALCNGQLMPISQNQALFALLGTTYGGNGVQTYALPNLQGRVAVSSGQSPSGSYDTLGATGSGSGQGTTGQQYLVLNYCICLWGIYPSRS